MGSLFDCSFSLKIRARNMRWVSYSEVNDLGKCERYWYYKYYLKLTSNKPYSKPLAFGIYGHEYLATYYKSLMVGASIDEAMRAGGKTISNFMMDFTIESSFAAKLLTLMMRYIEYYHEKEDSKYRILAIERDFHAPISDKYGVASKVDVLKYGISGRHKGQIIVEDHKFTLNFWRPELIMSSSQLLKYAWVVENDPQIKEQLNGRKVDAAYYNQLRYREMDPDKNEFFRRTKVPLDRTRIANVMTDHAKISDYITDMYEMEPEEIEKHVTRRRDKGACENCDFIIACTKSDAGLDESEELALNFKPNEYGYN